VEANLRDGMPQHNAGSAHEMELTHGWPQKLGSELKGMAQRRFTTRSFTRPRHAMCCFHRTAKRCTVRLLPRGEMTDDNIKWNEGRDTRR
jgi:hypothetical protein